MVNEGKRKEHYRTQHSHIIYPEPAIHFSLYSASSVLSPDSLQLNIITMN